MSSERWRRFKNPWVIAGLMLSAVVAVGLGLFTYQVVTDYRSIKAGQGDPFTRRARQASIAKFVNQAPSTILDTSRIEANGSNPMLGNPEAKLRIVEFLDYECPFSRVSAPDVRTFLSRHPNDVLLIARDYPLESIHSHALDASIAARCIFRQKKPNLYWSYHDLLFQNQEHLETNDLHAYASQVGADVAAFDTCVQTRATETEVKAAESDGDALGLEGTPTFFFNQRKAQGALDLATLEEIYAALK